MSKVNNKDINISTPFPVSIGDLERVNVCWVSNISSENVKPS